MQRMDDIEKPYLKTDLPTFNVGDTVEVAVRIREVVEKPGGKKEEKERIQTFVGTVIGRKGSGVRETFTVRRIVQGEGVERTFPIHSPKIAGITVTRLGRVRRAKLYYLRDRTGKATKVREKIVERPRKQKRAAGDRKKSAAVEPAPASADAPAPTTAEAEV